MNTDDVATLSVPSPSLQGLISDDAALRTESDKSNRRAAVAAQLSSLRARRHGRPFTILRPFVVRSFRPHRIIMTFKFRQSVFSTCYLHERSIIGSGGGISPGEDDVLEHMSMVLNDEGPTTIIWYSFVGDCWGVCFTKCFSFLLLFAPCVCLSALFIYRLWWFISKEEK